MRSLRTLTVQTNGLRRSSTPCWKRALFMLELVGTPPTPTGETGGDKRRDEGREIIPFQESFLFRSTRLQQNSSDISSSCLPHIFAAPLGLIIGTERAHQGHLPSGTELRSLVRWLVEQSDLAFRAMRSLSCKWDSRYMGCPQLLGRSFPKRHCHLKYLPCQSRKY